MIYLHSESRSVKPGKIVCIGRNYAKHAAELGNAVPSKPMIFLKPSTALLPTGGIVHLPAQSRDVHHEVELVATIRMRAKNVDESAALDYVDSYAVGLDLTARDIQGEAKKKGHPWSVAKGFDTFAPIGESVAAAEVGDVQDLNIRLVVNGTERQNGDTKDMIFSVAHLVSYCSGIFTLEPGDLIYTGTPEGVSKLESGDELVATVEGLPALEVRVK